MARARTSSNGRLDEAMRNMLQAQTSLVQAHATLAQAHATLAQTQAALQAQMVESDRLRAEAERRFDEYQRVNTERFARIEAILFDHSRILAEHTRILEALPDAVRERMGFPIAERRGPSH